MKLPANPPKELSLWSDQTLSDWDLLIEKTRQLGEASSQTSAFEEMMSHIQKIGDSKELPALLQRRPAARALTSLWNNKDDPTKDRPPLNTQLLDTLIQAQQPRLSRLTLLQLLQIYFQHFDLLDGPGSKDKTSLCQHLQEHLVQQLQKQPPLDPSSTLGQMQENASELLDREGPGKLVRRVRAQGLELEQALKAYGLEGLDTGRYGDVCRAHYFLDTLRELPVGENHKVFTELLKPAVSKAPYQQNKRIGHAALEILIDRATDDPGENWQDFIMSLAGDPRIASSATNYREWWRPLGEERIAKVRGWLSKEDLRLFLQAVEQYGEEKEKTELQRMFPARKVFLEGLFRQNLIRSTRLMLGDKAQEGVRKFLKDKDKDVKTNFASLTSSNNMSDKAVIYLDCGDFHLIEGSHVFKIWAYMAAPSRMLQNYDQTSFSHDELTKVIPEQYQKSYPDLPYGAWTHTVRKDSNYVFRGAWQGKVISFLAQQGISLDWEQLFTQDDYRYFLKHEGLPWVNPAKTRIPAPQYDRPVETSAPTVASTAIPRVAPAHSPKRPDHTRPPASSTKVSTPRRSLSPKAQAVLQYFTDNPGDKARYAATILDMDTQEVNRLLYGPLKPWCVQDKNHGWIVTSSAPTPESP